MKEAIIHLRKVVTSEDQEVYLIDDWENVMDWFDTPQEYDAECPSFWERADFIELFLEGRRAIAIKRGMYFSRKDWEEIVAPAILDAGKRLSSIRRKQRWSGTVEFRV